MHEISRHAIHISEVISVSVETLEKIGQLQKAVYQDPSSDLDKAYQEQAQEYMSFQLQILKSLKSRSTANHERLKSEITVVIKPSMIPITNACLSHGKLTDAGVQ